MPFMPFFRNLTIQQTDSQFVTDVVFGNASDGEDVIISSSQEFGGSRQYHNLTVNSGVILTIGIKGDLSL